MAGPRRSQRWASKPREGRPKGVCSSSRLNCGVGFALIPAKPASRLAGSHEAIKPSAHAADCRIVDGHHAGRCLSRNVASACERPLEMTVCRTLETPMPTFCRICDKRLAWAFYVTFGLTSLGQECFCS